MNLLLAIRRRLPTAASTKAIIPNQKNFLARGRLEVLNISRVQLRLITVNGQRCFQLKMSATEKKGIFTRKKSILLECFVAPVKIHVTWSQKLT